LEFGFEEPVPAGYVAGLGEKALARRVEGAWYRSPNRNRQLEYFDEHVSIRVYPKSGTCRIHLRQGMTFDEVRVHVEDAFARALPTRAILSESFGEMMNGLQVARRHRTFHVGPVAPFKVDFYRPSLGLDILADGSHPEHLEVRENWPAWIPSLMEFERIQTRAIESNTKAVSEFASQISSHLHVMQGIGLATDRLNRAIQGLSQVIPRRASSSDLEEESSILRGGHLKSGGQSCESPRTEGHKTTWVRIWPRRILRELGKALRGLLAEGGA
jgi:hypothetical protein